MNFTETYPSQRMVAHNIYCSQNASVSKEHNIETSAPHGENIMFISNNKDNN